MFFFFHTRQTFSIGHPVQCVFRNANIILRRNYILLLLGINKRGVC
ncbi:hypothetical protein MGSAQ_001488 [marine sediment metagenome]|uniref:Uncharacterized protein n=1 Tax=marine sediment metagenome TaxID=412755 RepID=A0A1B6NU79_9ZZZZ